MAPDGGHAPVLSWDQTFHRLENVGSRLGSHTNSRHLTCLHALVILFRGGRPVVGFVDGCPEALVAAPPPDDSGARPVEREVPVEGHLCDSRLEALEGAGLLQAE